MDEGPASLAGAAETPVVAENMDEPAGAELGQAEAMETLYAGRDLSRGEAVVIKTQHHRIHLRPYHGNDIARRT